jgi:hypothetical protein
MDNEYMTSDPKGSVITFEDGVHLKASNFWADRTGPGWEDDYSIYVEQSNTVTA